MANRNNKLKAFIIAGIALILVLTLALAVPALKKSGGKGKTDTSSRQAGQTSQTETAPSESDDPLAVLFCASDYQIEKGWGTPAENLSAIIHSAVSAGKIPDGVILCGDYTNDRNLHDYQLSPEDSISEIREIVSSEIPDWSDDDPIVFVQGNHDAMTDSITESGLHEYDDYLVYVINTQNDFPWKQGKTSGCLRKVREASAKLDECFAELVKKGEKRPVIIAGHVPLHFTARTSTKHKTGDNLYASLMFNAVNKYGKDLNIVYLYGHNHSKGWDCYLGGSSVYMAPGSRILIPKLTETQISSDKYTAETLQFTYMNAGYTGYYMNCGPAQLDDGTWRDYESADSTLTGTVIEIYTDRIEMSRWDAEGMHDLGSDGAKNPYKGGVDLSLISPSEYKTRVTSPQSVERY